MALTSLCSCASSEEILSSSSVLDAVTDSVKSSGGSVVDQYQDMYVSYVTLTSDDADDEYEFKRYELGELDKASLDYASDYKSLFDVTVGDFEIEDYVEVGDFEYIHEYNDKVMNGYNAFIFAQTMYENHVYNTTIDPSDPCRFLMAIGSSCMTEKDSTEYDFGLLLTSERACQTELNLWLQNK